MIFLDIGKVIDLSYLASGEMQTDLFCMSISIYQVILTANSDRAVFTYQIQTTSGLNCGFAIGISNLGSGA